METSHSFHHIKVKHLFTEFSNCRFGHMFGITAQGMWTGESPQLHSLGNILLHDPAIALKVVTLAARSQRVEARDTEKPHGTPVGALRGRTGWKRVP
jgi:hypothetical protein